MVALIDDAFSVDRLFSWRIIMAWESISFVTPHPAFSKSAMKEHARLKGLVQKLIDDRAALDNEIAQFRNAPATTVAADANQKQEYFQISTLALLEREIQVRFELEAFVIGACNDEWKRISDEAGKAFEDAEPQIRKKLVTAGFVDTPDTKAIGAITTTVIRSHPDWQNAIRRMNESRDFNPTQFVEAQEGFIQKARERIEHHRLKGTSDLP